MTRPGAGLMMLGVAMVVAWIKGRVIPGLAVLPRYRAADELCLEALVVWFAGSRSCRCIPCRLPLFFEHQGMVLREFQPDYSLVLPPGIVHRAVVPVEVLDGELQERLSAFGAPLLVVLGYPGG